MNKLKLSIVLGIAMGIVPGLTVAADLAYGKLLHDSECLACHSVTHYTREPRKVNSWDELRKRVAYCRDDVGAEWDAAEFEEVVHYMNTFYQFQEATDD